MKICIVGGTGNISTSIVQQLLEQGHQITCFNRGKAGTAPKGVQVITGDRKERDSFEKAIQKEKFDAAIDMICYNRDDAASDVRAFRGVSHFIHISTVCTYGVDYDWLPVTEDHCLRPITDYGRNKVAADEVFQQAQTQEKFPVTIVKPSTTYGPKIGLLRQIAWDFSWLNRILQGRPILICGDGHAIHQFMHVDDAARAITLMLGRKKCIGRTYNLVNPGYTNWKKHHETAMQVLGQTVEMFGVTCQDLEALAVPNHVICQEIFAHNCYYSDQQLRQDIPEYKQQIPLAEGIQRVFTFMQEQKRIPVSEPGGWEDLIIERIRKMRTQ